uniref:SCP domain-containing protein n=1 Tax=Globodera pallida TaxID=36090 RepID=A0A183CAC0_GLOPA
MNKWTATSLVLLIAILCGAIHGAVVREQQQPLDAALQQAPDHSNGTERTDTDNAEPEKPEPNPEKSEPEKPEPNPEKSEPEKPEPNPEKPEPNPEKPESEKPEPNPEKSEPDQSELYPAELDESEGEQARMKRDNNKTKTNPKPVEPPKPVNANTSKPVEPVNANTSKPVEPLKPPKPVNATTSKNETETEEPGPVVDTNSTEPTPPSNTTGPLNPADSNKTDTSNYEPLDDPNVNRKYTANLFYWEPETKTCRRKANADAEKNPKTDEELTLGKISVINKTAVAGAAPKTDSGNDELFNKWSECAKIQFYGELGLDDAKSYFKNATAAPEEEFSDLQAFVKFGFMQDMVLLLLDGVVVCAGAKEKDAVTVTLSIVQDLDAGLIPTLCPAIKEHEYG